MGRVPFPVLLLPTNSWTLAKVWAYMNMVEYGRACYYEDDTNDNKIWMLGVLDAALTNITLPCMLALPHFLTNFFVEQGHCLPHMLWSWVTAHIDSEESQVPHNDWQFLDWCLAASQTNADGNSLLQLSTLELALSQDPEFSKWCARRLDIFLGAMPTAAQQAVAHQGALFHHDMQMVERITNQMGCWLIAGVQALAPAISGAHRGIEHDRDTAGESVGGKWYLEDNVMALRGFCTVVDVARVPIIWEKFQHS